MVGFVGPGLPELRLLAGNIPLVFWDQGDSSAPGPLAVECGGKAVAAPILTLSAPLEGGGARRVLAFATPDGVSKDIVVKLRDGTELFSIDAQQSEGGRRGAALLEPATLMEFLSDTGRVRVVRFLLQACRTAFGLSRDEIYIDNMGRLVEELSRRPGLLEPLCMLDKHYALAAGRLPAPVGENPVAVTITGRAVQETPLPPTVHSSENGQKGRRIVLLPIHRSVLSDAARVVVFGATGVAIRSVMPAPRSLEAALSWLLAQNGSRSPFRDYTLRCLTQLGQTEPSARHAVREVLLMDQAMDGAAFGSVKNLISIDCAIAASDHVFLSGVITDPYNLIQSVGIAVGSWSARLNRSSIQTYSVNRGDNKSHGSDAVLGFAILARGSCPVPQFGTVRLSLTFASGASLDAAQAPLLLTGTSACDAILSAVPTAGVTEALLTDVLLPAIDLVQETTDRALAQPTDPIEIGTRKNAAGVSLIMPINLDLGLFKTWAAAIGGGVLRGPEFELVAVAPTDGGLAATERMLTTLNRQFGIASRLVSAAASTGPRGAFGAGVHAATGDHLVLLDGSCIPADRTALETLTTALTEGPANSLVGGVILDPVGSIRRCQFTPPEQDRLGNPYEGFPEPQLDSLTDQSVFAFSTSLVAVAKSAFEEIGGFSDDFLTRDWTDADFCLKARSRGCDVRMSYRSRAIRYAGDRPAGCNAEPLASQLDARRFSRNWQSEILAWSEGENGAVHSEPGQHQTLTPANVGNPRWAA